MLQASHIGIAAYYRSIWVTTTWGDISQPVPISQALWEKVKRAQKQVVAKHHIPFSFTSEENTVFLKVCLIAWRCASLRLCMLQKTHRHHNTSYIMLRTQGISWVSSLIQLFHNVNVWSPGNDLQEFSQQHSPTLYENVKDWIKYFFTEKKVLYYGLQKNQGSLSGQQWLENHCNDVFHLYTDFTNFLKVHFCADILPIMNVILCFKENTEK